MFEIDFLQVSTTEKSGDAITARFLDQGGQQRVIVVDAGFRDVGYDVQQHINTYYGTNHVDIVFSTHPDGDHINGLQVVLEQMSVGTLVVNRPSQHGYPFNSVGSDDIEALVAVARRRRVTVTEAFTGASAFDGMLRVAGPSKSYYKELMAQTLVEKAAAKVAVAVMAGSLPPLYRSAVIQALAVLPPEVMFDDDGGTTTTNNTSLILSLAIDGQRMLLTGDAGVPALTQAVDYLDETGFSATPLSLLQVPHHGSRHNLDTELLNRLLGPPGFPLYPDVSAFVSASAAAPKHPSPKITNALLRRGARVYTTETGNICHHSDDAPPRWGWYPAPEVGPRSEDA